MPVVGSSVGVLTAGGMLRAGTPLQHYPDWDLYVKREDLSCPPPGPPFSKTRGVYSWVKKQDKDLIGVLDTYHSQGGWAVSRACQILKKRCLNFYPEFKHEPGPREPQLKSKALGAELYPLQAGRSAILYHQAKRITEERGGVMIPNALKLEETVEETAKEAKRHSSLRPDWVIIPASSGTIAAGVIRGFGQGPKYLVHLGYGRSTLEVRKYLIHMSGVEEEGLYLQIVDEGYDYKDKAKAGPTPPWPCNQWYDMKTFRWYTEHRFMFTGCKVLFWNVG